MNEVTNAKDDRLVEVQARTADGKEIPVTLKREDFDKLSDGACPGPGNEDPEARFVQVKEDVGTER